MNLDGSAITAKPLLRVLKGESLTPPPFWFMRQAGRYLPEYRAVRARTKDFLTLCYTPELAVEVTLQPIRRFGMDAAILFADILLVPHALGQSLSYREGEGPVLEPVAGTADLARLEAERASDILAPVYETVSRLHGALPNNTALIGFAGAPWTVACYMVEGGTSRDFRKVKSWAYGDPEGFAELIALLVETTSEYLIQQVRAGADVVQLFDTWAGVLSEPGFRRWCVEPVARIVERLREACPHVPVIGFPRGAGPLYAEYARATAIAGVSIDTSLPPAWAATHLQDQCAVQGNLDPVLLLTGGPAMDAEARRILDALGGGPFVFNLGHGILPETPPDHVAALAETIRSWQG